MIFGMVFEILGDEIDESDVMHFCGEPEKIADIVMSKVDEVIGDISNVCKEIEEKEKNCIEEAEFHCTRFSEHDIEDAIDELDKLEMLSNSCPVNKDAIMDVCILRSKEFMEQDTELIEQNCEFQWEDYGQRDQRNCEMMLRDNICDEDEYVNDCMDRFGVKPEDFECKDVSEPYCGENAYAEPRYDGKGCITHHECIQEEVVCPDVGKPSCSENERWDMHYDSKGCAYYECIQKEIEPCPDVSIGQCGSGENMELRYDDRRCVVGYDCIKFTVCGNNICEEGETPENCHDDCGIKCPLTDEEINRLTDECLNKNGVPEKVVENDCILEVTCAVEEIPATDSSGGGMEGITGNVVAITGNQVLETYDDFVNQCKREWEHQEINCENMPKECGKEHFIDNCVQREKKNFEREAGRVDKRCELDTKQQIRQRERDCQRMERDSKRCVEQETKRCKQMQGTFKDCNEKLTEENFRKFVIKEATKKCRFASEFIREEVYSGSKPRKVIEKILELKERGVPGQFKGILDDEADELLDVSESLEELGEEEEEKGIGYKIKLFLGFAKEMEDGEIERLELSKERLETSIKSLSRLVDELPEDTAKAILKEQVADLERQKEDIESLIEQKHKKSKGLLRLFGLFG